MRQTDRRTDGQTNGFAIAYSALSMLSHTKTGQDVTVKYFQE